MATKSKATAGGNVKGRAKAAPQSQADKLEERVKRVRAKAADRQAKDAADIEKLEAAAEAEKAKQAAKAAAEAAKAAEAERLAEATGEASKGVAEVVGAEAEGLVTTVGAAWRLGEVIVSADLKARPVAIVAMGAEAWQAHQDEHAKAKAEGKVKGQAQPKNLSKVNDSVNVRKAYGSEAEAVQAARDWLATDPSSVSLRSFAKGESVNKGKRKGAPMSARDAARLFATAVAREGLTEEQAMDLIAEAMASIAG